MKRTQTYQISTRNADTLDKIYTLLSKSGGTEKIKKEGGGSGEMVGL